MSTLQQQQITNRLRIVDTRLQHLERDINDATDGDTQLLETLKLEHHKYAVVRQKLKAWVASYAPTQQLQLARSEMQQNVERRPRTSDTLATTGSMSFNAPPPIQLAQPPTLKDPESPSFGSDEGNVSSDSHLPHRATSNLTNSSLNASSSQPHGTQPAAHFPPQIVTQMSNLAGEQRNPHANSLLPGQSQETYSGNTTGHHAIPSLAGTIWKGALTWTGFDATTQGRKDVCAEVIASVQSGGDRFVFLSLD
jgi:hypothetical protein